MKWRLTGTPSQQAIITDGFSKIKFPWDRVNITWNPELGWRDLNSGYQSISDPVSSELHSDEPHAHNDDVSPDNEGKPEPLNGRFEGREFTMGVFYPGSGKIFIDYRLERYPAMAQATLAAEIAHAVDEFLPLTEDQKNKMIIAMGCTPGETTWWERYDYSTEYWSLAGEMFMSAFTDTYSDIPFGDVSSFKYNPRNMTASQLVEIMGIRRTDWVEETPPPPPPPEVVLLPEEPIILMADPVPAADPDPVVPEQPTHTYVRYGKSKIVHTPDHYPKKTKGVTIMAVAIPEGMRPCKRCKPD